LSKCHTKRRARILPQKATSGREWPSKGPRGGRSPRRDEWGRYLLANFSTGSRGRRGRWAAGGAEEWGDWSRGTDLFTGKPTSRAARGAKSDPRAARTTRGQARTTWGATGGVGGVVPGDVIATRARASAFPCPDARLRRTELSVFLSIVKVSPPLPEAPCMRSFWACAGH